MSKQEECRAGLAAAADTIAYLRRNSGLPGPRGNLELVQAAADLGSERDFRAWIAAGSGDDPTDEFLVVCGVVGLGRLAAEGRTDVIKELRRHAADTRWRVREGVAMALQRLGDADVRLLMETAAEWVTDRPYVQRAAIAGVAEPRLLKAVEAAELAVDVVDRVTSSMATAADRRSDEFRALRQALGYCWSVVAAAAPAQGKARMESWATSPDRDVRWMLAENLKKARLVRVDAGWVERMKASLADGERDGESDR
jgi:hypothetical protein